MARPDHEHEFTSNKSGVYHCTSRCVRREPLCGVDEVTGIDNSHRRDWIYDRTVELAALFAIDIGFFATMDNHLHLVLRRLPQLVKKWSKRQVLLRSLKIYPSKFKEMGVKDGKPTAEQMKDFAENRFLIKELRSRLSNISWFMKQLKQSIATRANREDDVTGHFFEGRFKAQPILDETGVLVCGMYVDLNKIRAAKAQSIQQSTHTSGHARFKGLKARLNKDATAPQLDGFLCPLNTRGDDQTGYPIAGTYGSLRASDTGLLEMTVEQYLAALDWLGRQTKRGKRGKIPEDAPHVLAELGVAPTTFVTMVEDFEQIFHAAIGTAESLAERARQLGLKWVRGVKQLQQDAKQETKQDAK